MSTSFQNALSAHTPRLSNCLEFRRVWAPVWINLCKNGDSYFVQESNYLVATHVVAALMASNPQIGQEVLGLSEYNRFMAIVNDATKKFNAKATSQDTQAHKVLSALTEAVNQGLIS